MADRERTPGTFTRPRADVLPDEAMIPAGNLASAVPARFTHTVATRQPYYFDRSATDARPAGWFEPGTDVALIERGEVLCHVVDAQALQVWTACAGLVAPT